MTKIECVRAAAGAAFGDADTDVSEGGDGLLFYVRAGDQWLEINVPDEYSEASIPGLANALRFKRDKADLQQ